MSAEALSRALAARIPGAKAFPGGGVAFARRGFDARVEFEKGHVDLLFDTRDLALEAVEVSPAGLWHDVRHLVGWRDTQLGDPDFDPAFEIHASEPGFAEAVLTPPLRQVLRSAARHGGFHWRLSPAGFLLRVRPSPSAVDELDRWLGVAYQLLDALPGADGRERIRVGPARQRIDAESMCRICGTGLAQGKVVRCAKCATPHHADCWDFNGRCAIFACGEVMSK